MVEANVTGIGALERFIRLFPDMFVVEGEGQTRGCDAAWLSERGAKREFPEIKYRSHRFCSSIEWGEQIRSRRLGDSFLMVH